MTPLTPTTSQRTRILTSELVHDGKHEGEHEPFDVLEVRREGKDIRPKTGGRWISSHRQAWQRKREKKRLVGLRLRHEGAERDMR